MRDNKLCVNIVIAMLKLVYLYLILIIQNPANSKYFSFPLRLRIIGVQL